MARIYCEICEDVRPLKIERMQGGEGDIGGDLICGVCSLVIATVYVDEVGEYEFAKVS